MDSSTETEYYCKMCGGRLFYNQETDETNCECCGRTFHGALVPCGKDRCGNCHTYLSDGDKYCRICGTKVGEGAFEPFLNVMQCIYGPPPVERIHTCTVCGYSWTTMQMSNNQHYCPKCGNKVTIQENDRYNY